MSIDDDEVDAWEVIDDEGDSVACAGCQTEAEQQATYEDSVITEYEAVDMAEREGED